MNVGWSPRRARRRDAGGGIGPRARRGRPRGRRGTVRMLGGGFGSASAQPSGSSDGSNADRRRSAAAGTLTRPPPRARRRGASRCGRGGSRATSPRRRLQRLLREDRETLVLAERRLHDAVLQRVVRDHDHAASGSEEVDRLRQGGGELLELPVDRDAERLERPTRGVGAPRTSSHGAHDDAGQLDPSSSIGARDARGRWRRRCGATWAPGRTRRSGRRAPSREARSRGRRRSGPRRPSACRAVRPAR